MLVAAGAALLTGCTAQAGPPAATSAPVRPTTTLPSTTAPSVAPVEPVTQERLASAARGTEVGLVLIRPTGVAGALPVCLALHGRGSTAGMFLDLGVPALLDAHVAGGGAPFAVAAVDGGDTYWVARTPADDPQRMLLDEVPGWLAQRGLGAPVAGLGISMGGFGVLNYARAARPRAVATISAALFTAWSDAKVRNVFADQAGWERTEPLRHVADLAGVALGVWCGTGDPFIRPARRLIRDAHPAVAELGPGGHDGDYWHRVLPEVLKFVEAHAIG